MVEVNMSLHFHCYHFATDLHLPPASFGGQAIAVVHLENIYFAYNDIYLYFEHIIGSAPALYNFLLFLERSITFGRKTPSYPPPFSDRFPRSHSQSHHTALLSPRRRKHHGY